MFSHDSFMPKRQRNFLSNLCLLVFILCFSLPAFSLAAVASDTDGDGIPDTHDNCREVINPNQLDSDRDGFGNVCDADYDNNNIVNMDDFDIFLLKFESKDPAADLNGDSEVDIADLSAFYALINTTPGPGALQTEFESGILGRVVDIAGVVVADSTITVYQTGEPVTADVDIDSDGAFSVFLPAEESFSLNVSAPGYSTQVVPILSPPADGQVVITVTLIKRGEVMVISDPGVTTQSAAAGAGVTFDKADFVDSNGQPVEGNIELTITPVNVAKPASMAAFPGSFSGLAEGEDEPSQIFSLGTVEYHFSQNGETVNLAPGASAEVLLPMYATHYQDGSDIAVGHTIPIWYLNESTGIWQQEGTGEVVASEDSLTGLALRATVHHFSWWNVDLIASTAYVKVTVLGDTVGTADIVATAKRLSWKNATTTVRVGGTTDALPIPTGTPVQISAFIRYDDGSYAIVTSESITAEIGQLLTVALKAVTTGAINITSIPVGVIDDQLDIYTVTDQPVPIEFIPLTREDSVIYVVVEGELPDGLTLESNGQTGRITGNPSVPGTYHFEVVATDSDGYEDAISVTYVVENISEKSINLPFSKTSKFGVLLGLHSGQATINWNDGSDVDVVNTDLGGGTYGIVHEYASPIAGSITITFSNGLNAAKNLGSYNPGGDARPMFSFDVSRLAVLANLETVNFSGNGSLTGTLQSLPDSLIGITFTGPESHVVGTIETLNPQLKTLQLGGYGGITGAIKDLPRGFTTLYLGGRGTDITGDISELPGSLQYVYLQGNGKVSLTGDIADLPAHIQTVFLQTDQNIVGNIADIPDSVTGFYVSNSNTITGNIANLPSGLGYFSVAGENTISGNLADIGPKVYSLYVYGNNTITGNIASLPEGIRSVVLQGKNTVYGDLAQLRANDIHTLYLTGANTVDVFSELPVWVPHNLNHLILGQGGSSGFDADEVDRFLNYLSNTVPDVKDGRVYIYRTHDASPTTAADEAISRLEGKGFTVLTR
ncbi:putative Ig domain-containing protein [Gynuella sunshinyii]|uniref:Uncharacterized protein n=1 Tax=Gynuella sunshinyii YC6258 TaxID=1445510 RepID=A0A0C5VC70_9GAMM|nr:putative Ig domain-containing protein [Gynuella sunshinyii]AJQ96950.1 hypothetical Protein YC6258_04918 [Gynuella sunshinyii YC6258]